MGDLHPALLQRSNKLETVVNRILPITVRQLHKLSVACCMTEKFLFDDCVPQGPVWRIVFYPLFAPALLLVWWLMLVFASMRLLPLSLVVTVILLVLSVLVVVIVLSLTDRWLASCLLRYFEWYYLNVLGATYVSVSIIQDLHSMREQPDADLSNSHVALAALVLPYAMWLLSLLILSSIDALVMLSSRPLRLAMLAMMVLLNALIVFYNRFILVPSGQVVSFTMCWVYCVSSQYAFIDYQ
jgi:hypothetical protein